MLSSRAFPLIRARVQLCPSRRLQARLPVLGRLLNTLAILEQREGQLNKNSLSAVTAAQKLGGSITGFIAGSNVKPLAEEAAKVQGVERIIVVENGSYDKVRPLEELGQPKFTSKQGLPENYAPMLAENIKKGAFTHIIAGHSAFGKNLMPRVAALLDVQQVSDVTEIHSEDSLQPRHPPS